MSSWFKKPVNIGITIGAALLAIAVVVLIVWGVTHHTEGGLLCVRWHNGQAVYLDHEVCDEQGEGASELRWPPEEAPFTVVLDQAAESEYLAQADRVIPQIIRDVNAQVPCELVRRVDDVPRDGADIWFHWGVAYELGSEAPESRGRRGAPEFTEHRGAGVPVSAHVSMRSGLSDRGAYLAGVHGLLHALGLGHDDFRASIMFPLTPENPDMGPLEAARITDHDAELLGRLYCGGRR